jgi:PmbA protein
LEKLEDELSKKADAGVRVEYSLLTSGTSETFLVNSLGFSGSFEKSALYEVFSLIVEGDGKRISGYAMEAGLALEELDSFRTVTEAAGRLRSALEGKIPPRGTRDLLIEPYVASQLLRLLSRAFNTRAYLHGDEPLPHGRRVASPVLSIIDDATMERGLSSFPFDGEGFPGERKKIVDRGRLVKFLHDSQTAAAFRTKSTGNAVRSSYRDYPAAGITNLFIEPGNNDPDRLKRDLSEGFLLKEIVSIEEGMKGSDAVIVANGVWIKGGSPLYPVSHAVIRAGIAEIMGKVVTVTNDLRFFHGREGSVGSPTLLCEGISIE